MPTLDGQFWRRFHLALTALWALLAIPSMLWWRDSVPYLVFLSVYAIVAGHASAYQGARVEACADVTAAPPTGTDAPPDASG